MTTISKYATETFNPTLDVFVSVYSEKLGGFFGHDWYELTLKDCVEKLTICDGMLIYKKYLPQFEKLYGTYFDQRHANLYELFNFEFISEDTPQEYRQWFRTELDKNIK